jgi:hypothetical protein
MPTLTHCTLRRNVSNILKRGLLASKATGRRAAVWFVRGANAAWACLHVAARHGGRVENVVALSVRVPRRLLKHHGKGLFYVAADIPAAAIVGLSTFGRLAAVPAA